MQHHLNQLGLTQVEKVLPQFYETAHREQPTAEIDGRDRRAAKRRMSKLLPM